MDDLALAVLGPPSVTLHGAALHFRTRKALALCIYLAVAGGHHPREALATLLWPESDTGHARTLLRQTLSFLRGMLTDAGVEQDVYLTTTRETIALVPGALSLDLEQVQSALTVIAHGTADGTGTVARTVVLQAAVDAYRGDFLAGFSLSDAPEFDDWASMQREIWHQRMHSLFAALIDGYATGGETTRAIAVAQRWVNHDPLHEEASRRLIQLYLIAGDRAGAHAVYARLRAVLATEMGVEPTAETAAIAAQIGAEPPAQAAVHAPTPAVPTFAGPLVGRAEEYSTLIARYHRASHGQTQMVVVEGEAGIGKTRLVDEWLGWVEAQGIPIRRGRAFESAGRLPYQPIIESVRSGTLAETDEARRAALGEATLGELSRLMPELRERDPTLPSPMDDPSLGQLRLFEAVARAGEWTSRGTPVVFFYDDMQWADTASRDMMHFVLRRWRERNARAMVIMAMRAEALATDAGLASWLAAMGRDMPVTRLRLGPLTAEATAQLVRTWQPTDAATTIDDRLYRETAGHPFFLMETLEDLVERGVLVWRRDAHGTWTVVQGSESWADEDRPAPGVRAVVRDRLVRLSPSARDLVTAGAVLGQRFTFAQARAIARLDEDDALRALDEAVDRLVLREATGEGGESHASRYLFAHDKIQEVVYTEAGGARRQVFHRRALAVLEGEGAEPATLAHHAREAGQFEVAFRLSLAAGDAALALFAMQEAIGHYERARQLLGEPGNNWDPWAALPAAEIEHAYINLGRAYELAAGWEQAHAIYVELRDAAQERQLLPLQWSALTRLAIQAVQRSDNTRPALALLAEARTVAERGAERALIAETYLNIAHVMAIGQQPDVAIRHGEQAIALARELGLTELTARALAAQAWIYAYDGQGAGTYAHAMEARALYATLREWSPPSGAVAVPLFFTGFPASATLHVRSMEVACLWLAIAGAHYHGDPQAGIAAGRDALALAAAFNNPWMEARIGNFLAFALYEAGDYEEALALIGNGITIARRLADPHLLSLILVPYADVSHALLRIADGQEACQEALALADREPTFPSDYRLFAMMRLCTNRSLAGDWEAAAVWARETVALRPARPASQLWTDAHRHHVIEALLRDGDEELARREIAHFQGRVGRNRRLRITSLRSQAVLMAWEGHDKEALTLLDEALALAEALRLPHEQWEIGAELTAVYRRDGQAGKAQESAARAVAVIQSLAERIADATLREEFLAAPTVQRLFAASQGYDRQSP